MAGCDCGGRKLLAPAASARGAFETWPAAVALSVAAASAVAVLALSALLVFDALLFRLMASQYERLRWCRGGWMARMRLKPSRPHARSTTAWPDAPLLFKQRVALACSWHF